MIRVNAKAGCGKSFHGYRSADKLYAETGQHTLVVTFSELLKVEGRAATSRKDHIRVETYHSLINNLFGRVCFNGEHFRDFMLNPCAPVVDVSQFHSLILDEIQDMNSSLYWLVCHLRRYLPQGHTVMRLGDFFQNVLRSLQGSDLKYLQDVDEMFGVSTTVTLNESFRLTPSVTSWINANLNPNAIQKHYPRCWTQNIAENWGSGISSHVSTNGRDNPVDFYRFPFFKQTVPNPVVSTIKQYVAEHGSSAVLIIVRSCKIKPGHPVHDIIFQCPEVRWAILQRDIYHDKNSMRNKALVATPWKIKGYQAKCVVVVGMDASWEQGDPMLEFSLLYTACSRPTHKLIVLSDERRELFFTMRENIIKIERYESNTVNVSNLVTYNQFDPFIDTLETSVVCRAEPIETETSIESGDFTETIGHHYEHALKLAMFQTLTQEQDRDVNWHELVSLSIQNDPTPCHQLPHPKNWVDCDTLDNLLTSALDLLPDAEIVSFHLPVQKHNVFGVMHFLLDEHKLVQVTLTQQFDYTQGQESLLIGQLVDTCHECYVLNPTRGELRKIAPIPKLLHEMLERKFGPNHGYLQ